MGVAKYSNNGDGILETTITDAATTIVLGSGQGANFPSPTGGDYCWVTLEDSTNIEIVKCTARSTDTLTVVRSQQSTSNEAFTAGAQVDHRLTADDLSNSVQLDSSGDVSVNGGMALGTASAPGTDALLDMTSTAKGLAVPSMTTTQRDAIASGSPAQKILIYNTTTNKLNIYTGSWEEITSASGGGGGGGG